MKTILLIEDNALIRENTGEILALAGYAVRIAENGKVGVEQALANKPDLVVCDIIMPVLDGYGVLQAFNGNPLLAGIPFIFLTAKTEQSDLRRGMALGADDFLTKPYENGTLLSAVAGRLNRFQHLQPESERVVGSQHNFGASTNRNGLLTGFETSLKPYSAPRKHRIYAGGDEATFLYFVQAGRVKTCRSTSTGKELITAFYQPGEFFGYQAMLQGTVHYDSAIATEDSHLLYTTADHFRQLMLHSSEVNQQFVRMLANRVGEHEELLLGLSYHSLRQRVASALLRFSEQQPANSTSNSLITLAREDIAAIIGTAPESLSRILSEFQQEGIIELTRKSIELLEPKLLRLLKQTGSSRKTENIAC